MASVTRDGMAAIPKVHMIVGSNCWGGGGGQEGGWTLPAWPSIQHPPNPATSLCKWYSIIWAISPSRPRVSGMNWRLRHTPLQHDPDIPTWWRGLSAAACASPQHTHRATTISMTSACDKRGTDLAVLASAFARRGQGQLAGDEDIEGPDGS